MPQPTMNGAVAHPLVQKIVAYQLAIARGDVATGSLVFHDDVCYVVPGANVFSGTYRGPAEVMATSDGIGSLLHSRFGNVLRSGL